MFAIIRTGGKQYKVSVNDKIVVEKVESEIGSKVTLDQVLMVGTEGNTTVGTPLVSGAQVIASVEKQTRDAKIIVFKKKRRHNYRRKRGHKQHKTILKIIDVIHGGKKVASQNVESAPKIASSGAKAVAAPKITKTASAAAKKTEAAKKE